MTWVKADSASAPSAENDWNTDRASLAKMMKCPKCAAKMLREGSYHHNLLKREERRMT